MSQIVKATKKPFVTVGFSQADYVCNGTADQVKINEAITAVNTAGGGIVFLKAGTYNVTARIIPKSNVTLCGEGVASRLKNVIGGSGDIGIAPIIRDDGINGFSDFGVEDLTFIGDGTASSTSCSIYLTGDRDINVPGAPVISNFFMRRINIRENNSLPIRLFGLSGKLLVTECEFTHNADAGFGFCEEVIFTDNHSVDSRDNGFSISRGNRKVVCVGNTIEDPEFWGIWLSGFANQDGPTEFICNGNVIINPGKSGIALKGSPKRGAICGNYIDQGHNRATNSDCDGIQIYGDSSVNKAENIVVSGNTILNAARAGIGFANCKNCSFTGNLIVDAGTEFKADGTTVITSTETTTNVGILSTQLNSTNIWVDGNYVVDTRTVPLCNYDIWKINSTASGISTLGVNHSVGMRSTRNSLDFTRYVDAGSPLSISANGPDASINTQLNNQGNGEIQVRGGLGLNIESVNSGTSAEAMLRFSGGATTSKMGGITLKRTDPVTTTLLMLHVLANGTLTGTTKFTAPLFIQGQTGGNALIGFNGGMQFTRREVFDTSSTLTIKDYIVAYTSLSTGRTVNLPTAADAVGQTYIIKDESGTAATNNLTVTPFSLGAASFTDADVDVTNNIIRPTITIANGTPITLSTAGTLPSPFLAATTYYVTRNSLNLNNLFSNPGTVANDTSVGRIAWSNPSNASGSDNTYATWLSDGGMDPADPQGDTQVFAGASITATDKTLTTLAPTFVSTDAGKDIYLPGAGTAGGILITTIKTFTSDTEVELTAAAGTTVAGVNGSFGYLQPMDSNYLKATNYGFSVPASANIEGIKVEVEGKSLSVLTANVKVYDVVARLIKGGTISGDDNAANVAFGSSDATKTYGATDDLWGVGLTPTDVNASSFGFVLQVNSVVGQAMIDNIKITVYYTLPQDIKLSDTLAHAQSGTAIDITTTGSGTITISSPAQTIDGASTKVINLNYGAIQLYSTGAAWEVQGGLYNTSQGNVTGPSSATDNAITRFDGTTGKIIQNSGATIDDSGNLAANTITPNTDDGAALGSTSKKFSDLFLADGAVLNFNSGDLTLTKTSTRLEIAGTTGAVLRLPSNGGLEFSSDTAITRFSSGVIAVGGVALKAGSSSGNIAKSGGTIFDHFVDATVGGAEADIYTDTTPANIFNTNGDKIIASYGGNFVTVGTELTQLKVYFAGTAIWDSTGVAPSTGTTAWRVFAELIRVSSTVVRYTVSLNTTGASGYVYAVSGELTGLTLSGTNILKITGASSGVASGSGDIVGKMGYVKWESAA